MRFDWKPNHINITCRTDIRKAVALPSTVAVLPTTYISLESATGLGLFVTCAMGIAYELVLWGLFVVKSKQQVIRAASKWPSYMIFLGELNALFILF